jgi:serine protease inhibitor
MAQAVDIRITGDAAVRAANGLTERWARRIAGGSSTVFAGAGVWPLLGLLATGADGDGRRELTEAFGLGADEVPGAVGEFLRVFDEAVELRAALGLWYDERLRPRPEWLDGLPPATRGRLTGDATADQAALDDWASRHTNGLIRRMPGNLGPETRLVLASALAVELTWRWPFDEHVGPVASGPWAGPSVRQLRRRQITVGDVYRADTPDGAVTVTRVEGAGDVDVYLLLGPEDAGAATVLGAGVAALRGDHPRAPSAGWTGPRPAPGVLVTELTDRYAVSRTDLTCVPFEITAGHDLLADAGLFGLGAVSDAHRGHFPGISAESDLAVRSANQSAMARFTAQGFQSAAVTSVAVAAAIAMRRDRPAARLTAVSYDRPHAFVTVHRPSTLIVTAGWLAAPGG